MSSFTVISPLTVRHPDLPGGQWTFPNEPRINISLRKSIITTPVAGRDAAVVEIIGAQNYQLQIEGVTDPLELEGDADELPEEAVRMLHLVARINAALEVECEWLAMNGIRNIVIEGLDISNDELADQVSYRIDAISDEPFALQLAREPGSSTINVT